MNMSDERTRSLWMGIKVAPDAEPLSRNATADTVVIGSGIAGLSTAYELAALGQKVVVLDRGTIGGGVTARTTAHLTSLCDESFKNLVSMRGLDVAKGFYASQAASIDVSNISRAGNPLTATSGVSTGFYFQHLAPIRRNWTRISKPIARLASRLKIARACR
jgi:glycine/D-amino acid oxidase-like deaminating enzyme